MTSLEATGTALVFVPMLLFGILLLRREHQRRTASVGTLSHAGRFLRLATARLFIIAGGLKVLWVLFVLADMSRGPSHIREGEAAELEYIDLRAAPTLTAPLRGFSRFMEATSGIPTLRVVVPEGVVDVGMVATPRDRICVKYRVGIMTGKVRMIAVMGVSEKQFAESQRSCQRILK